jgi:hypothetical protein
VTRLGPGDVACWALKSSVPPERIVPGWPPGVARTVNRCLRASYRLGLMLPGMPCLLWVSGRDRPGVHAVGELAGVPDFAGAEVVRMPAGSNPSWLWAAQFAAVRARAMSALDGGTTRPGTMGRCVATGSGGERSAGS